MINIIGNFLDTSGYSIHTRNIANALNKITDVRLDVMVPGDLANLLNDEEVKMLKKEPEDDQINLIITNPMHWRLNVGMGRNWAFMIWEGDKIPKSWISECLNPDIEYIFVPSKHTYHAIMNRIIEAKLGEDGYIQNKIKLIPHGVDLNIFKPLDNSQRKKDSCEALTTVIWSHEAKVGEEKKVEQRPMLVDNHADTFTFLCNKGFRNLEDRGGIQYAIQAFFEEFNSSEKVQMLVKLNPAYGITDLNRLTEQLKPRKENLPVLKFDVENYKYEDLVKLYNQADVFVSPTRAESFNIPCIEAMACGVPVITTDFGGQTDYVDASNGWVISGDLKPVQHEIQYEETKWLTPDITQLKKAMREAYENGKTRKEKGEKALEKAKEFTWDITAQKIVNLI